MMRLHLLFFMLLFAMAESRAVSQKTWVILNNLYKGAISFEVSASGPCLSQPLMEEWGVRDAVLARLVWDAKGCLTPQSAEQFNLKYWYRPQAQLLTLLFPTDAISPQQNGVSTSRWDDGINALFINYRLDADHSQAQYDWERSGTDATLSLDNGLNVGPWRLRYQNTFWREKEGQHGSYTNAMSLWRSITPLRSRVTLGDGNTSSNMFDSLAFRGASLGSDEAMYPDSWRPYSPWINGYARTEAEVTIHQNGVRVYRIHVPPGPFTIRDFYPPDPDGNLELTVQESDGTERTRLLPYSSMPNLVHHGLFATNWPPVGISLFTVSTGTRIASGRVRSRGELPRRSPCLPGCSKGSTISARSRVLALTLGGGGRFPQMSARLAIRKRRRRNGARCGVCAMPKRSLQPKPASPLSSSGIHVMNITGRWKKKSRGRSC